MITPNLRLWSDLPNAHHIDRVLNLVRDYPKVWHEAWLDVSDIPQETTDNARTIVFDVSHEEDWRRLRELACSPEWGSFKLAKWDTEHDKTQAWGAAWFVVMALLTYDDVDEYMEMSPNELKIWATLSEKPCPLLLLPAVAAFEKINERSVV